METYNIKVKYAKEVFIPVGAIDNNVMFMISSPKTEKMVVTSDGKFAKILSRKTVNILSEDGTNLLSRIYAGFKLEKILREYYNRLDGVMSSLEFQYMRLSDPLEDKEW